MNIGGWENTKSSNLQTIMKRSDQNYLKNSIRRPS
jgi:hypothetical protein